MGHQGSTPSRCQGHEILGKLRLPGTGGDCRDVEAPTGGTREPGTEGAHSWRHRDAQ